MGGSDELYRALAVAGTALGVIALVAVVWLALTVRRLRRAQVTVLGGQQQRDLVAHAEALERDFALLRDWLEDATAKIDQRMAVAEQRLDGSVAYRSMIRYDAFGEMTGQQSSTVALLDSQQSGIVLSAIRSRNHSHVYVKQVVAGQSDIDLSPEEQRAVNEALAHGPIIATKTK